MAASIPLLKTWNEVDSFVYDQASFQLVLPSISFLLEKFTCFHIRNDRCMTDDINLELP